MTHNRSTGWKSRVLWRKCNMTDRTIEKLLKSLAIAPAATVHR